MTSIYCFYSCYKLDCSKVCIYFHKGVFNLHKNRMKLLFSFFFLSVCTIGIATKFSTERTTAFSRAQTHTSVVSGTQSYSTNFPTALTSASETDFVETNNDLNGITDTYVSSAFNFGFGDATTIEVTQILVKMGVGTSDGGGSCVYRSSTANNYQM